MYITHTCTQIHISLQMQTNTHINREFFQSLTMDEKGLRLPYSKAALKVGVGKSKMENSIR